jgi:uncharacterized protein (TIGR02147 family)
MENPLNIYSYTDYRSYLRDFYIWKKEASPGFSYRVFSRRAEVKAPNFLQWLIEGKRNLAHTTIPRVCTALGLTGLEIEYFHELVLFNQSETIKEKTVCFLKLAELRKPAKIKLIKEIQFEHYQNWYNEAIRELLSYYRFVPTEKYAFRKLARLLAPEIDENLARKAIKLLLQLALIEETDDGSLRQSENFISTGDEVDSFLVRTFHQTMITLAGESLDRFPRELRDVSSVTMSISDDCFDLIKKEIQVFRKHILEMIKLDKESQNVYQLNFQFFPLTKKSTDTPNEEILDDE